MNIHHVLLLSYIQLLFKQPTFPELLHLRPVTKSELLGVIKGLDAILKARTEWVLLMHYVCVGNSVH